MKRPSALSVLLAVPLLIVLASCQASRPADSRPAAQAVSQPGVWALNVAVVDLGRVFDGLEEGAKVRRDLEAARSRCRNEALKRLDELHDVSLDLDLLADGNHPNEFARMQAKFDAQMVVYRHWREKVISEFELSFAEKWLALYRNVMAITEREAARAGYDLVIRGGALPTLGNGELDLPADVLEYFQEHSSFSGSARESRIDTPTETMDMLIRERIRERAVLYHRGMDISDQIIKAMNAEYRAAQKAPAPVGHGQSGPEKAD